jgi:hypothetical protein
MTKPLSLNSNGRLNMKRIETKRLTQGLPLQSMGAESKETGAPLVEHRQ